jgi:hypothetical protein
LFGEQVKFFLVPVSDKLVPNTSIDSVDVLSKILEKNKPVKLYTSVRNFNTIPLRNEVVSVFLDKVRAAQTNVSADAMGSASTEFTFTPKHRETSPAMWKSKMTRSNMTTGDTFT